MPVKNVNACVGNSFSDRNWFIRYFRNIIPRNPTFTLSIGLLGCLETLLDDFSQPLHSECFIFVFLLTLLVLELTHLETAWTYQRARREKAHGKMA